MINLDRNLPQGRQVAQPVTVQLVIDRLRGATQPGRGLDSLIAELQGWTKKIETTADLLTGEERRIIRWFLPSGEEVKVPFYTSNIQHAYDFAQLMVPFHVGGCSWENGKGKARINDGPYVTGINPQIALCVAVLMHLKEEAGHP